MKKQKNIERNVRAALKDKKRFTLSVGHYYPVTEMKINIEFGDRVYKAHQKARCSPEDNYNEQVGYELVFERCVNELVEKILNKEWALEEPRMKQSVLVEDFDSCARVWCDNPGTNKRFLEAYPFITRVWHSKGDHFITVCFDKRYVFKDCFEFIKVVLEGQS